MKSLRQDSTSLRMYSNSLAVSLDQSPRFSGLSKYLTSSIVAGSRCQISLPQKSRSGFLVNRRDIDHPRQSLSVPLVESTHNGIKAPIIGGRATNAQIILEVDHQGGVPLNKTNNPAEHLHARLIPPPNGFLEADDEIAGQVFQKEDRQLL